MKLIFKIGLTLLVGFVFLVIYLLYFSKGESIAIELSKEIEEFKMQKGHYPNCTKSVDLIDSLALNGNEWYPEYFSYHLDNKKQYYLLKIYNDKKVEVVYDSRTKKERRLK